MYQEWPSSLPDTTVSITKKGYIIDTQNKAHELEDVDWKFGVVEGPAKVKLDAKTLSKYLHPDTKESICVDY